MKFSNRLGHTVSGLNGVIKGKGDLYMPRFAMRPESKAGKPYDYLYQLKI
jgi:hypothetical protein